MWVYIQHQYKNSPYTAPYNKAVGSKLHLNDTLIGVVKCRNLTTRFYFPNSLQLYIIAHFFLIQLQIKKTSKLNSRV